MLLWDSLSLPPARSLSLTVLVWPRVWVPVVNFLPAVLFPPWLGGSGFGVAGPLWALCGTTHHGPLRVTLPRGPRAGSLRELEGKSGEGRIPPNVVAAWSARSCHPTPLAAVDWPWWHLAG